MNQILITQKLYLTPELKRKKKIYKINFILSIIVILVLTSYYVYAEYDRNKDASISEGILAAFDEKPDENITTEDILVVSLQNDAITIDDGIENDTFDTINEVENTEVEESEKVKTITVKGKNYSSIGSIQIPKIKVEYPILAQSNDVKEEEANLKISPVKFFGPNINEIGNLCIAGHNYRNSRFFSKVPTLEYGDIINITDLSGNIIEYKVYNVYTVDPKDLSCTDQDTDGRKDITLITCTNDSQLRVIVKATASN